MGLDGGVERGESLKGNRRSIAECLEVGVDGIVLSSG